MSKKYIEDTSIEGRRKEIAIKRERINALLDEQGLDALVLVKASNFSWMTAGGTSWLTMSAPEGVVTLLVTKKGCYAIMNILETLRMREEQKLEELGFEIITQAWIENKTISIIEGIVGGSMSRVGSDVPMGNAKLLTTPLDEIKYTLTENEVCRYQHLGDTLSAALEEYIVTVKPGMTEHEITGGLCNALWKRGIEQILYLVSADDRAYRHRHGVPTDKKLKNHLNISVNGRYKGLITSVTRMVHFGKTDNKLVEQYDVTAEIECRTIAATKIGSDEIEAYNVNKQAYADAGFPGMWDLHAQGGPEGYNNRYYIITPTCHGKVPPYAGYCFNPVIDGTKTEDGFITTPEGPLFITKPISFPVVEKTIDGIHFERPGLVFID